MVLFVLASAPAVREPFSFYAGAFRSISCNGEEIPGFARNKTLCRAADRDGFQSRLYSVAVGNRSDNPKSESERILVP